MIGGTTDAWTGQLDLANNALVISGGGATGTANVSNQIRQGFLGENTQATLWTGLGISSSTAADDPLEVTALGVLQNNLLAANSITGITTDATPSNIIYSTFGGESVGLNDTLVMFTYFGDVLLEQQVSSNGYFAIDTAWAAQWTTSTSIAGWINGDFDEDGQITSGDYYLIDQAFAHRGPAGSVPDVTLQEDDPAYVVSLRDYFSDPLFGSETLTFAVVSNDNPALFTGNLTAGGSINTATGELTLTLAADANGEATLTLTATDPTGAQRIFTLHIIVDAVDDAPRLSVIPLLPSNLPSGTPVSVDDQGNLIVDFDNVSTVTNAFNLEFNVGGSNPDAANGSTLSYELIGTTNGATIDSATGDVTQSLTRPTGPVNEQLTVRVTRHHGDDPDISTDRVIDIAQGSATGFGFTGGIGWGSGSGSGVGSGCGYDIPGTFLPIAKPESYTVEDDGTLTVSAHDGLLKDARFGGAYTSLEVDNPTGITVSHGTLTALADGSLHYVAEVGYYGLVPFQFRILVQPALAGAAAVYSEFVAGEISVKPAIEITTSNLVHYRISANAVKGDAVLTVKTDSAHADFEILNESASIYVIDVKTGVIRLRKGVSEVTAWNDNNSATVLAYKLNSFGARVGVPASKTFVFDIQSVIGISGDTQIVRGTADDAVLVFTRKTGNGDNSNALDVGFEIQWDNASIADVAGFTAADGAALANKQITIGAAQSTATLHLTGLTRTTPGALVHFTIILKPSVNATTDYKPDTWDPTNSFSLALGRKNYKEATIQIMDGVIAFASYNDTAAKKDSGGSFPGTFGISINDIHQSDVGDCFLLASLMALARLSPGSIKSAIQETATGKFDVSLYGGGQQHVKYTYDFSTSNVLSQGLNQADLSGDYNLNDPAKGKYEIWVNLIEKAYRELATPAHFDYGGSVPDAWSALTGETVTDIRTAKWFDILVDVQAGIRSQNSAYIYTTPENLSHKCERWV